MGDIAGFLNPPTTYTEGSPQACDSIANVVDIKKCYVNYTANELYNATLTKILDPASDTSQTLCDRIMINKPDTSNSMKGIFANEFEKSVGVASRYGDLTEIKNANRYITFLQNNKLTNLDESIIDTESRNNVLEKTYSQDDYKRQNFWFYISTLKGLLIAFAIVFVLSGAHMAGYISQIQFLILSGVVFTIFLLFTTGNFLQNLFRDPYNWRRIKYSKPGVIN
jgi:hypothetical protein